jgi:hypothetical protein
MLSRGGYGNIRNRKMVDRFVKRVSFPFKSMLFLGWGLRKMLDKARKIYNPARKMLDKAGGIYNPPMEILDKLGGIYNPPMEMLD